jgi:hypothetical protein
MKASQRKVWLGLLGVALLVALVTAQPATAQPDWRQTWAYDSSNRVLQNTAPGRWVELIDGRPVRYFDEVRRTPAFVEVYTEAPMPGWVLIFPRRVYWRVPGDPDWRPGGWGRWLARG